MGKCYDFPQNKFGYRPDFLVYLVKISILEYITIVVNMQLHYNWVSDKCEASPVPPFCEG